GGSPAIVKRTILADHPTVLLDNWHTVFRGSDKNQFTGFLLNGCDQAHDVASFDSHSEKTIANLWQTFCPKAFAGLESLPPSLAATPFLSCFSAASPWKLSSPPSI